jgi:hypothetical protein
MDTPDTVTQLNGIQWMKVGISTIPGLELEVPVGSLEIPDGVVLPGIKITLENIHDLKCHNPTMDEFATLIINLCKLHPDKHAALLFNVFHPVDFTEETARSVVEIIKDRECRNTRVIVTPPAVEEDPSAFPGPDHVAIKVGPGWKESVCRIDRLWESRAGEIPDLNIEERIFTGGNVDLKSQRAMWDLIYPDGYTLFTEKLVRVPVE